MFGELVSAQEREIMWNKERQTSNMSLLADQDRVVNVEKGGVFRTPRGQRPTYTKENMAGLLQNVIDDYREQKKS